MLPRIYIATYNLAILNWISTMDNYALEHNLSQNMLLNNNEQKQEYQKRENKEKIKKSCSMKQFCELKNKELKLSQSQLSSLKQKFKQTIQQMHEFLPIFSELYLQYIGKKGIDKQVVRLPLQNDLLKNQLDKVYDKTMKARQKSKKSKSKADEKVEIKEEKLESMQMQVQETPNIKKIPIIIVQSQSIRQQQQKKIKRIYLEYEQKSQIIQLQKIYINSAINQFNQLIIDYRYKQRIKQCDKALKKQKEPHLFEQQNKKIEELKFQFSKFVIQNKFRKMLYLRLLKKFEDTLPQIIEDQNFKSERIQLNNPKRPNSIIYLSIPPSQKDLIYEIRKLRTRIYHYSYKKTFNILLPQNQFEKQRLTIKDNIINQQLIKQYLQNALIKMNKYYETSSSRNISESFQGKSIILQKQPMKKITLKDEGEGQDFNKNNSTQVKNRKQNETTQQKIQLWQTTSIETQKLKMYYLILLDRAKNADAPFLNKEGIPFIELKGSKGQKSKKICTAKCYIEYYLSLTKESQARQIQIRQRNIKKIKKDFSSNYYENSQQQQLNKIACQISYNNSKNIFLRDGIIALDEYLLKWEQLKVIGNKNEINKKSSSSFLFLQHQIDRIIKLKAQYVKIKEDVQSKKQQFYRLYQSINNETFIKGQSLRRQIEEELQIIIIRQSREHNIQVWKQIRQKYQQDYIMYAKQLWCMKRIEVQTIYEDIRKAKIQKTYLNQSIQNLKKSCHSKNMTSHRQVNIYLEEEEIVKKSIQQSIPKLPSPSESLLMTESIETVKRYHEKLSEVQVLMNTYFENVKQQLNKDHRIIEFILKEGMVESIYRDSPNKGSLEAPLTQKDVEAKFKKAVANQKEFYKINPQKMDEIQAKIAIANWKDSNISGKKWIAQKQQKKLYNSIKRISMKIIYFEQITKRMQKLIRQVQQYQRTQNKQFSIYLRPEKPNKVIKITNFDCFS